MDFFVFLFSAFLHRRGSMCDRFLIPPPLGQPHSVFGGTSAYWLFPCFHRTLTWTTGYLTCVHGLSVCVRIHTGVGHTDSESQHNLFDSENLKVFLCSFDRIQTLDLWISSPNAITTERANPSHPIAALIIMLSFLSLC